MSDPTQSERSVSVSTPSVGDVLVFKSMSASEGMSQLFEYELELLSKQSDIDLNDMLGQSVTVLLKTDIPAAQGGKDRFFNGLVSRFSYVGTQDRYHLYQATLVLEPDPNVELPHLPGDDRSRHRGRGFAKKRLLRF